jgi:hypothetical protein
VPLLSRFPLRRSLTALLCIAAFLSTGCHHPSNISGYGVAWVTVTDEPGDFAAYDIVIDSVVLTRNDGIEVTAMGTPEAVDFTQLSNVAEFWGTATIPTGTYLSATITLDYTSAAIAPMLNGTPILSTVEVPGGLGVTTVSETVTFDPANPLVVTPTYASTSAELLTIDVDLAASGYVDTTPATPITVVRPWITAGVQPADTKLIRVRGPLINSSLDVDTFTVYVRPFFDEVNNLGTLSLFNGPSTIYTVNGIVYTGNSGLTALSQLSAGTTVAAAYTTFQPTFNPANSAPAGKFNTVYVIAGSTLEDYYTEGISGDVIARVGDTLTLHSSTLILNTADTFTYEVADTNVILGPNTIVTADGTTLTGLNSDSIAVGQHITARGLYSIPSSGIITLNSTGAETYTGSVRLQSTQLYGSFIGAITGGLTMDLEAIDGWPVSIYNFAGNGATTPSPADFSVSTAAVPAPAIPGGVVAGDPLFVNGIVTPFGSAPPDFDAFAVNSEASIQVAGPTPETNGTETCGIGSQICVPASLQVLWSTTGTTSPFVGFDAGTTFSINLSNNQLVSAVIRIGPESIDLSSLPAGLQIGPTSLAATSTFAPRYTVGNPTTSSTITTTSSTTSTTTDATTSLYAYSSFDSFVDQTNVLMNTANPALQFEARGVFNRAANTFTATTLNLVL